MTDPHPNWALPATGHSTECWATTATKATER